jgi:hypothetical protein
MATTQIPVLEPQTITIDKARIAEFQAEVPTLINQAQAFTIDDATDYDFSLTIAEEAIRRIKAIKDFFAPTKRLAHQLHGSLCDMENTLLAPYAQIERLIKDRRMNWRQAEEKKRREEEAAASRRLQEQKQQEALDQAAQLEKEGEKEAADVVIEQAMNAPAPAVVLQSTVPKQANSAVRKKWAFRIDNPELVQREYCSPDEKKIRAIVTSLGPSAPIKGITIYEDEVEAIRTKGR